MEPVSTEKNSAPIEQRRESRQFDWGPAVESSFEGGKEWAVYGLLLLLLGVCGWFLLDLERVPAALSNSGGSPIPALQAQRTQAQSSPPGPVASITVTNPTPSEGVTALPEEPAPSPTFFVQLGAFGDEDSAGLAMRRLKAKGFVASLTVPNEQYEMYRLLMGPFSAEGEAEKTSRQLNELDFPCFVVESP